MAYPTRAAVSGPDHESASKMSEELEAPVDTRMKVENVSIRPASNGGFIVTCSKAPVKPSEKGPGYESKDYAFSSLDEVIGYIGKEFGAGGAAGPTAPGTAPGTAAPLAPMMDEDEDDL